MYYEYWQMQRAPFDNVPDPTLYWKDNKSLEDAVCEILFAIEEGNDCLAVMVGEIGTGKTLALRVILNELNPEKYRIALITNPNLSTTQLMREIIGQLGNKKVDIRYKDQLMEEFNKILFECANKGQKVVVFIDEANAMSTSKLHDLRLLTNLQDDQENLAIFILAGQKELGKRLESKALENLYQRVGVYCRINGLNGPEAVKEYIIHRIKACGGQQEIFTEDAYKAIWNYSHHGIPRLINKIAKLCLKAGETNSLTKIEANIVHGVASMFESEKSTSCSIEKESKPLLKDHAVSLNDKMKDLIQGFPDNLRDELPTMEDKQLKDLAGKMAINYIRKIQPKSLNSDPVILWDSIKGQIFSILKSFQHIKEYQCVL